MSGLDEKSVPSYGSLSLDELGRDVREAQIGHRDDFAFDQSYSKGHQMVGSINFNSLNRIVSKYAAAAATPADVGEEPVAWRYKVPSVNDRWTLSHRRPGEQAFDPGDVIIEPLYSATALSAQEAEIERLRKERDDWKDMFEQAKQKHGYCIVRGNELAAEVTRLRKVVETYENGLNVLATTFYKDDQHQDYAKHVLAVDRRFLEETK